MTVKRSLTPRGTAKKRGGPVLRFRMRVTEGEQVAVGPGKIALLEAIRSTGSITAAAKVYPRDARAGSCSPYHGPCAPVPTPAATARWARTPLRERPL